MADVVVMVKYQDTEVKLRVTQRGAVYLMGIQDSSSNPMDPGREVVPDLGEPLVRVVRHLFPWSNR